MEYKKLFNPINFKDKVFNSDESFTMFRDNKEDSSTIHFIQDRIGEAKYIYAAYDWKPNFEFDTKNKFTLMAIVSGGKIYVVDDILFELVSARFYKENGYNYKTKGFEDDSDYAVYADYYNEFFAYIESELLPPFYDGIEVQPEPEKYIRETRRFMFMLDGGKHPRHLKKKENEYNPAFVLCGKYSRDEYGQEILNDYREEYELRKIEELSIEKNITDGTAAEEWEVRLGKAVIESGAKALLVEFEYNGNTAAEKMETNKIIYLLREKNRISDYDFVSNVAGEKLFKKLGIGKWESNMTCENITRIVFRGKDIYKKE